MPDSGGEPPDGSESTTVLVVEDEPELADLYTTWLEARYEVLTAYDGAAALEQLTPAVDVVLLDRRMPGLSGDEVLGRIREGDGTYQVAMVTAVSPDFDFLKLDFDEYVIKPVATDDLFTVIEQLLTRRTFEQDLQRALTLAAKKTALEAEKSGPELRESAQYEALASELASYREQVSDQLAQLAERDADEIFPYERRQIALHSAVISLVAALLIGVHFIVPDAQLRLLAGGEPASSPVVAYLLTFVHFSDGHLAGNLLGYLIGAFFTYALCMRIRAVRWFFVTGALLLTVLPVVTVVLSNGLLGRLYPDAEILLVGFSAEVAGFVGFAYLALLLVTTAFHDHRTVFFTGAFILLVLLDVILLVDGHELLVLTGIGTAFAFAMVIGTQLREINAGSGDWTTFLERLIGLLVATGMLAVLGLGLFPSIGFTSADPAPNANPTNVFGHFIGVIGGFTIAFATAFLLDLFPIRERLRRSGHALPDRLL